MHALITGSSGLIGTALIPALHDDGHTLVRLRHGARESGVFAWDVDAGSVDVDAFRDVDAVVHLAGASIAAGRWTPARKAAILTSRVRGTALIARTLSALPRKPRVLLSASAVGFYGDRGDALLDESSPRGRGFLADVCAEWEDAARPAIEAGIRVVTMRFGIVLSRAGGALGKMLMPFRLGLGGVIGAGTQYMSWITIDDVVGAIRHLLRTPALAGAVNVVAPEPATNRAFTRALGAALHRPTLVGIPAFAVRLALGEMADEMLLSSTRVRPARLLATGYRFHHPALDGAMRHVVRA